MNAPTHSPDRAQEGSLVCGGFTLGRLLRRDEVVSVYLARAQGDGHPRHVARVVHGVRPADAQRAAAFDEAATLLLELRHRGIPRVVAAGVVGAEPVVVAERVHAATLRDLVRDPQGPDPQELALALLRAAEVLDALHARSPAVIHRRLSPDNVLVSGAGEVWVEECGLAHCLVEAGWSPTSVAPAAPEYLTPTEALHRIDAQTDIFALATVAYECLTGAVPFAGDAAVVRAAVLERERPSVVALRPDLSRNVDAVLLRAWSSEGCGALEPYPSAESLARELLRVLDAAVRVTSPHAATPAPQQAVTVPPPAPDDVAAAADAPVRVNADLADLAAAVAPPAESPDDGFVDARDVVERSTDPPPPAALAAPPVAPEEELAASPPPPAPAAPPPAPAAEEAPLTLPPTTPSAVQTQPGIGAAPSSKPSAVTSSPPAATAPDAPPLVRVPTRPDDPPPREPMPETPPRTAVPSNLGPSIVLAAVVLAGAWIYTSRDARPPPPAPVVQQTSTLRAGEPVGTTIPELRPPAPLPPAPLPTPPPPAPVEVADVAPAPSSVDAAAVTPTPPAPTPMPPTPPPPAAVDAGRTAVTPDAGAAPGRPPQGELNAVRTMLQQAVEDCLEGTTVRTVRVAANYAGATGRPRVSIETPMENIEAAACIERAVIGLPVRRFGPGSWIVRYTFSAR